MTQKRNERLGRYKGCLLGIAIGDALGAPVEGLALQEIKLKYGGKGISDFDEYRGFKPGFYTDDTQMSLATAKGCIIAGRGNKEEAVGDLEIIYRCYLEWLQTQYNPKQRRGPGMSCLTSLQSGRMGTMEEPVNNSKGCGGVMRTAPAGLAHPAHTAFIKGARYAAITHGHPSGYLTAGFLAKMTACVIEGDALEIAIDRCMETLVGFDGHSETLAKVELARRLASSKKPVEEAIADIGLGWVGEEALGISIYCALKFSEDFEKGVSAAVNHSGDSDSTGSIAGAILGAFLGAESIPDKWVKNVENSSAIANLAEDMFKMFVEKKSLADEKYSF